MKLSLEFLQAAIAPLASATIEGARRGRRFRGARMLHPNSIPQKGFLYFREGDWDGVSDRQKEALADAGILATRDTPTLPDSVAVLRFADVEPADALDLVIDAFARFEDWSSRVLERTLATPDLESLMAMLNEVTPNPWYIADGSYRVLAARNAPEVEELSYIWRFLYRNRRLPLETILAMEDMGKIEQMSRRKKAYIPSTTPFNIPFVSKSVSMPDGAVAHFYLIGVYTRPSQYEIELADFFGDVLGRVLAREGRPLPVAVRFYDGFLSDLAQGVIADDAESILQKMFADFGWNPSDQLQLAVFSDAGREGTISEAQRLSALESRCDARGFHRDGLVAAVINLTHSQRGESFDDEASTRLVRPLAREMRCSAGLSERFSGYGAMRRLQAWYDQARFAAAQAESPRQDAEGRAGGEPAVVAFPLVAIEYFRKEIVRAERLDAFMHPALAALRDYDTRNDTLLSETLRVYLENDRNVTLSSGKLFVHRNTLLKRLRKVKALTALDLDDPECRMRLLMSFAALANGT